MPSIPILLNYTTYFSEETPIRPANEDLRWRYDWIRKFQFLMFLTFRQVYDMENYSMQMVQPLVGESMVFIDNDGAFKERDYAGFILCLWPFLHIENGDQGEFYFRLFPLFSYSNERDGDQCRLLTFFKILGGGKDEEQTE
jgi:hypothetical protein